MDKSIFSEILAAPLVAIGASEATVTKNHVLGGLIWGAAIGWIMGLRRGKSAPDSNMVGF